MIVGTWGMDEARLRQTMDRVEIDGLLSAYADAVTRRAWGELDDMFLPDCEVVIDTRRGEPIRVVGGRGVGGFVAPAIERFDFFEFTILNTHVEIDGGDEASGRLYMCELRHDRELDRRTEAFGLYQDRYQRVDDAWRFAHRRYSSLARTADVGDLAVFPLPET
jgi:hypothetical protein